MSMYDSIRQVLTPIHKEGYPFIAIAAVASLVLGQMWEPLGWLGLVITLWVCYFFRDPERQTPVRSGLVVSPADGRVSSIAEVLPPPELELGDAPLRRISIFMNVFDCHVNRSPVDGVIERIVYTPGIFINADLDKASEDNERNGLVIVTGETRVGVVQIAGLIARRIVSFVRETDALLAGERFGLIRFGSRVDVYLPLHVQPLVGLGQRAVAGETVLADLTGTEPAREYRCA
ncbi:phosphatidylserine decarboxylase [Pseudochelatococcus sp. G4_1912]|uniref:phosphatidylserine decarboxylase n=1 Tax=Pseudochelatococcus sp. G4_1912 TaxID=3114288 RepID=UPI0039C7179D